MKLISDIVYGMILTFTNKHKLDKISKKFEEILDIELADLVIILKYWLINILIILGVFKERLWSCQHD